jgi:hypothetical protein
MLRNLWFFEAENASCFHKTNLQLFGLVRTVLLSQYNSAILAIERRMKMMMARHAFTYDRALLSDWHRAACKIKRAANKTTTACAGA